jgi:hypothetical protein
MEGLSFVTPVIGLNRPNTGKEEDDDDDDAYADFSHITSLDSYMYVMPVGHGTTCGDP